VTHPLISRARSILRRRAYLDGLFPAQRAFFDDPAKTKGAYCSRRAGKTWVCSAGLYDGCQDTPESASLYVALTGKSARHILWPVLRKFDRTYQAGLKFNDTELIATDPNGSQIMLTGADQVHKIEALRGRAFRRIVIDEAQAFPKRLLRYLLDDVLEAALMDLDGDQWLIGTPNAARAGHFYDLITGSQKDVAQIPSHTWTVLDNPHIPHAAEWLAGIRAKHHWTLDTPVYQREYMGRWVRDESQLVFRFDRLRHLVGAIPKLDRSVGGADIGTSEEKRTTALTRGGWARHDRTTYFSFAKKYAALNPTSMADEMRKVGAELWMLDEGGLGKGYGDEFRKRQQDGSVLNVRAAKKQEKHAYIEHMNGEYDGNRIKILAGACDDLVDELELLQWDDDRKEFDPSFQCHACDAHLYQWRECWSFAEEAEKLAPIVGSAEWYAIELAKEKAAASKQAAKILRRAPRRFS
jgi:hypothetical protein